MLNLSITIALTAFACMLDFFFLFPSPFPFISLAGVLAARFLVVFGGFLVAAQCLAVLLVGPCWETLSSSIASWWRWWRK